MSTTSFSNMPQAVDDSYVFLENSLGAGVLLLLDVMANDRGGNAKTLFSIDDGAGNTVNPTDLLNADGLVNGVSAWEATASGNLARINNGKVEVDLSHSLTALGAASFDALTASDHIHDTFVYAIRLGNGTLSWAHVSFDIQGQNDAASISGDSTGALTEDATSPAIGALIVADVDHGQAHTQAVTNGATANGLGTYSIDANGHWSYTVDNAAVQYLGDGQSATDSFIVSSLDGSAHQTVTITINGADESPPELSFVRADYAAGSGPEYFVFGDLNGDGAQDMVVADVSGNSFAELLGNGNGSFAPTVIHTVGSAPHAVAAADLNGDGNMDVVTGIDDAGGQLALSFGNGDGTFQPPANISAGGLTHVLLHLELDVAVDLVVGEDRALFSGTRGPYRDWRAPRASCHTPSGCPFSPAGDRVTTTPETAPL